jgi:hypothetical protein
MTEYLVSFATDHYDDFFYGIKVVAFAIGTAALCAIFVGATLETRSKKIEKELKNIQEEQDKEIAAMNTLSAMQSIDFSGPLNSFENYPNEGFIYEPENKENVIEFYHDHSDHDYDEDGPCEFAGGIYVNQKDIKALMPDSYSKFVN